MEIRLKLPRKYDTLTWQDKRATREEYIRVQGGKCYHCKSPLDQDPPPEFGELPIKWQYFPLGFLKHPVHLHHDHDTGYTIGAVHAICNAVLWQYHGE